MRLVHSLLPASLFIGFGLLVPSAHAQNSYAMGISAGPTIPTGKFSDAHSKGKNVTGFLAIGTEDLPIGFRLDGMYNDFKGRTVTPAGGGAAVETPDLRLLALVANGVFTASGSVAKPYLVAGMGFYNSKTNAPDAKSRNDLGFSIGLGSTFSLGPLASTLELRFHSISREPENGGSIHYIPITVGIAF